MAPRPIGPKREVILTFGQTARLLALAAARGESFNATLREVVRRGLVALGVDDQP